MVRHTFCRARPALAALLLAGALATRAGAQRLPVKTSLAASGVSGCAAFPAPVSPAPLTASADADSRRLIATAQEAALQGEHAAARDAFMRAAQLSPANARVAYYLGREHEALGESPDAVREYCRYLALAAAAPDADEVRGRVVRLTPASEIARVDEARANFRSGVALLQRRQYAAADSTFGQVMRQVPTAPEPWFNRALSRAARGDRTRALADFERYLELSPAAPDRALLRTTMSRLPERVYGPGQALASGLVVPGLGQMSTGRPVLGVIALGAVGGAVALALQSRSEVVTRTFTDPFGNSYVDSAPRTVHPAAIAGLSGAAVLWLGAAIEAMTYARRSRANAEGIIAPARPEGSRPVVGLAVQRFRAGGVGIGLALRLAR
jgi:tetratricopeptide (TPR) repeat protein